MAATFSLLCVIGRLVAFLFPPPSGLTSALYFLRNALPPLLGIGVDHPCTTRNPAIFCCITDGVVHSLDSAFVHEVHNQFQLMEALEVGDFRLIARFYKNFKTRLHQLGCAAAQYSLLTEKIRFCLFFECGFQNSCTGSADRLGIGKSDILG